MSEPVDIEAIEARLRAATDSYYEQLAPRCSYRSAGDGMACGLMSGHDGPHTMLLPPSNGWGWIPDLGSDLRALLAEVRRLITRLAFFEDVPEDGGWCNEHPRRVQADTVEMVGGDSSDGGDVCLACEIRRLTEECAKARDSADFAAARLISLAEEVNATRALVDQINRECASLRATLNTIAHWVGATEGATLIQIRDAMRARDATLMGAGEHDAGWSSMRTGVRPPTTCPTCKGDAKYSHAALGDPPCVTCGYSGVVGSGS